MSRTLPLLAASALADPARRPPAVVALAAGTEPSCLLRCLCGLALQRSPDGLWLAPGAFGVVLVPNGPPAMVTGTLAGLGPSLPFAVRVTAPVPAGDWALRAGLAAAADWVEADGAVLATDAAAVPEAGFVAEAVAALAGPAELVLGEVVARDGEPDAAARYAGLLARLAARLDPDPLDPDPAHGQAEAASFGIRACVLTALGGLPMGAAGGLPGLLAALRLRDGRIRHQAGMRVEAVLPPAPAEPALAARGRLLARRAMRQFWADGTGVFQAETAAFRRWSARLGMPAGAVGAALSAPCFGAAWAAVEAASPVLAERRQVAPAALPRESLVARLLLATARSPRAAVAQRPGGLPAMPGSESPAGSCRLRKPGGAWNRAGSCGP